MSIMYKGIELEGLDKDTKLFHSVAMHHLGQDPNVGTEYLDQLCEYKRADVPPALFDEINKLWSVVKMNYQICNGGIHQYYVNGYDNHYVSEDREVEIFDKDEQVKMLQKLYGVAIQVFPDNLVENSKLFRIIEFFDSLEYEESVPQYGTIECEEDEEIWDEELEEYVPNPDYFEPYEDVVDHEDEVRTTSSAFKDYSDDVSRKFDKEYYDINGYLERLVEVYAQFLEKSIQKELALGVDGLIQDASGRAGDAPAVDAKEHELG